MKQLHIRYIQDTRNFKSTPKILSTKVVRSAGNLQTMHQYRTPVNTRTFKGLSLKQHLPFAQLDSMVTSDWT